MIQNNLDPEVAEKPHELVVYGGRGKAARDWESFDAILESIWHNAGNLGTGIVLLLSGQAMRAGTFTVGDFSLFVFLHQSVSDLTTFAGMLAARYKQLNISVERMALLMEGAPPTALVEHSPVDLSGPLRIVEYPQLRTDEQVRPGCRLGH